MEKKRKKERRERNIIMENDEGRIFYPERVWGREG